MFGLQDCARYDKDFVISRLVKVRGSVPYILL